MSLLRAAAVLSALVAWSAPVLAEEPAKAPVEEPAAEPAKVPGPIASGAAAVASGAAEEPVKAPGPIASGAAAASSGAAEEPAKVPGPIASGAAEEPAKAPGPIASGAAAASSGAAAAPPKPHFEIDGVEFNTPMSVGLTMFTLSYLPCLLVGPLTEDSELLPLMVPIAGPLILASGATADPVLGWAVFGSFTAAQTLGAAIFAFGALLPREPTGPLRPKKKTAATFRAAPFVTPTAWGASAQGSF